MGGHDLAKHRQPGSAPRIQTALAVTTFSVLSVAASAGLVVTLLPHGDDPWASPEPEPGTPPAFDVVLPALPAPPLPPGPGSELPAPTPPGDSAPQLVIDVHTPPAAPTAPPPETRVIEQDHGTAPRLPLIRVAPPPVTPDAPPPGDPGGVDCFLLCGIAI